MIASFLSEAFEFLKSATEFDLEFRKHRKLGLVKKRDDVLDKMMRDI